MERKDSLRQMVDWIIRELEEGKSIESDENGNISAIGYGPPRSVGFFTVQDLKNKN